MIDGVEIGDETVAVSSNGSHFAFSTKYGVIPKVGDLIRRYEWRSFTCGIDLNGYPVFYKTEEEMINQHKKWNEENDNKKKAQFESKRPKLDAEYKSLPPIFRKRIRWFRKHNPNFRWEYEAYELFCCSEAVKIAKALKDPKIVMTFMGSSEKEEKVPDLSYDVHSDNSMGMSCRLAYHYLNDEEMVFFEHGALVPLVGCNAYGCAHPRPGIDEYAKGRGWNES